MPVQLDTPTPAITTADSEDQPFGVLLGGWAAAREITAYQPARLEPIVERVGGVKPDVETNIFAPQVGLQNKIDAYRARRRLNRAFRRNQRKFEHVLDAVAHDPAGQRELKTIWTIGQ